MAEDTVVVAEEDMAAARGRHTRRFAQSANKNALSRSSQAGTVRFTARNASQSAEIAGVNEQSLGPLASSEDGHRQ